MMTTLIRGRYNCFYFLLFVTFIGLVSVNFSNISFQPSVLWLNDISQHLRFIYMQKIRHQMGTADNPTDMLGDNHGAQTNMSETKHIQLYHEAYPRNYQFVIDEPDICERRNPFLVLMVPVAPQQLKARNAIRSTWGNESVVQGKNVLVLFVVGLHRSGNDAKNREHLMKESRQYGDLIQSNFQDTYRNLTIKTMVILDWLATHCRGASYGMKIDSDIFLNLENLMSLLLMKNTPKTNYMTGKITRRRPVVRNSASKWYVPRERYAANSYPVYLIGMGYVFSNDLPEKIIQVSKDIAPFYIEDAYIGVCMKKLGLAPKAPPDPSKFRTYFRGSYDRKEFQRIIMIILSSPNQLVKFWKDIKS